MAREIDMEIKDDRKKHYLKDLSNDSTLAEMIVDAIRAGKITAYSNEDHNFSTKLAYTELDAMLTPRPDMITIKDPATGQEYRKIIYHDFDYDAVKKYRILEDWTFNPATGNTDVHIEGVAPLRDIVADGDFRGRQALFWARYADLQRVLERYEQLHPGNMLSVHIWEDYFYSDFKPVEQK